MRQAEGAVLVCLLAAGLIVSGCKEDAMVTNLKLDDSYIRVPGQATPSATGAAGSLMPLDIGNSWNMIVHSAGGTALEQNTVTGTESFDGILGAIVETRQNGAALREDVFSAGTHDLSLVAAGSKNDIMRMTPPIPLFSYSPVEGATETWSGILHYRNTSSSGNGLSRVSGRERVTTPAGTFDAYRIDSILLTTVGGQMVNFPSTRWFAPGVGVVKQRMMSGARVLTKELSEYHLSKK